MWSNTFQIKSRENFFWLILKKINGCHWHKSEYYIWKSSLIVISGSLQNNVITSCYKWLVLRRYCNVWQYVCSSKYTSRYKTVDVALLAQMDEQTLVYCCTLSPQYLFVWETLARWLLGDCCSNVLAKCGDLLNLHLLGCVDVNPVA